MGIAGPGHRMPGLDVYSCGGCGRGCGGVAAGGDCMGFCIGGKVGKEAVEAVEREKGEAASYGGDAITAWLIGRLID